MGVLRMSMQSDGIAQVHTGQDGENIGLNKGDEDLEPVDRHRHHEREPADQKRQRERHTRGDISGFSRRFQKKITHIVDTFWLLAASEDFRHPETQGKRPLGLSLLNSYSRRVHELSTFDPQVTLLLYQVLQAIKSPTALFSPSMIAKVLFKRQPRPGTQEGTSASRELSPVTTSL